MMNKTRVWVAGFGNEYREDDAAGVILAARLYEFLSGEPDVEATLCLEHQLLPELVDDLAGADVALFCDANTVLHEEGFSIREILPNSELEGFNMHSMGPEWLLALAGKVGMPPKKALLVTVSGDRFDFSETPTAACAKRIGRAREAFEKYWRHNYGRAE
ncbi:MAG: hydrogenase maturation protease [Synergistaceae bacterium]|jgi:hydrogenase maturation protease|nr:hydrogenase maturation protease [Synergistaceae bacterium]